MRKAIATGLVLVLGAAAQADLEWTSLGQTIDIDFTGFTGAGFAPSPAAGQLNSDEWRVTGLSAGDLAFEATGTTGDYAHGSSSGGATFGGVYAFDVNGGNTTLGIQPTAADFTPGEFILRIQNNTGLGVTQIYLDDNVYFYNDEDRLDSYWSLDQNTWILSLGELPPRRHCRRQAGRTIPRVRAWRVSRSIPAASSIYAGVGRISRAAAAATNSPSTTSASPQCRNRQRLPCWDWAGWC